MSEQRSHTEASKRQVRNGEYDSSTGKWTIEGFGEKPELEFLLYLNATLDSEKEKYKGSDEAQPKYPYIVRAVFADFPELFRQAKISTGWTVGKMARSGEFTVNAVYDDTPGKTGDQKFALIEGAEIPEIHFPIVRKARVQKTLEQQVAELPEDQKMAFLLKMAKELGLSASDLS